MVLKLTHKTKRKKITSSLALMLGTAMFLTACSGAAEEAPTDETEVTVETEESDDGNEMMEHAQAAIEAAKAPIEFAPHSEKIPLDKIKGKKVVFVSESQSNSFNMTISEYFAEAAEELGLEVEVLNGAADPSTYSALIKQSVAEGVSAIALESIGTLQAPEAVKAAYDAGIPVITGGQSAATDEPEEYVTTAVTIDTMLIGEQQIDLAYVETGGEVHTVAHGYGGLPQDLAQWEGQENEINKLCPDTCTWEKISIDPTTFQSKTPSEVQSALLSNPELNWFTPSCDFLAQYVQVGVSQAGAEDRVKISSWNGLESALDLVRDDKQDATFGTSLQMWGYAMADLTARAVAGMDAPKYVLPTRLVTKELLDELGPDVSEAELYGVEDALDELRSNWVVNN